MHVHELKYVNAEDLTNRVLWHADTMRYKYFIASALYSVCEIWLRKGKTVNRFLKQDFDKARDDTAQGSVCDSTALHLGVERIWVSYENTSHMGVPSFDFEINWYQTDPFADTQGSNCGRQTTRESVCFKYMPRFLTREALNDAFQPYKRMNDEADRLRECVGDIPAAVERYNAALAAVIAASDVCGGLYPFSQAFPFHGVRA